MSQAEEKRGIGNIPPNASGR